MPKPHPFLWTLAGSALPLNMDISTLSVQNFAGPKKILYAGSVRKEILEPHKITWFSKETGVPVVLLCGGSG